MNIDQWVQYALSQHQINYDGVYGFQCVDLPLSYVALVYGLKTGVWGNAIDYWNKPTSTLLTKFDKIATTDVKKGDIGIYKPTSTNPYGHIWIAVDDKSMIEQNGATGSGDGIGGNAIRLNTIDKSRILGILRPKGAGMVSISEAEYNDLKHWKDVAQLLTTERDKNLYPFVAQITGALGISNTANIQPAIDAIAKLKSGGTVLAPGTYIVK